MLNIKPPNYKFCPFCGKKLRSRKDVDGTSRKYCATDNWTYYPHVFDSAVPIITKANKVLLVKRAITPYKNTWNLPGGFLEYGEHPGETVIREIKEETGLAVIKADLIEVVQSKDDPRAPGHLIFFYKVKVKDGKMQIDTNENKDIGWFDFNNLPKIGWDSHRNILKKLQNGKI